MKLDQENALKVYAVKMTAAESFERASQLDLTDHDAGEWEAPEGDWSLIRFTPITDDREFPITHIDYLDSNAVAAFMEITNEAYYKRYGEHFGGAIPGIFFDEIYFNNAIFWDMGPGEVLAWTDDFAETFRDQHGYDLLDELPSLVLQTDGSGSVNYDYYQELTRRFDNAWFKQYTAWCDEHGVALTGHTMEDFHSYQYEGDFLKTIGRLQMPGTDNEDFRYNYPRYVGWFKPKQLSSVSHIYGKRYATVEAMGGGGYFITPEEYRYGIARLGVCGINFIIPHFFHYSVENLQAYTDWPPSWFFRNPYWKYFKPLADYGRRVSYMNTVGNHVCHVAVLFPLAEQWALGQRGQVDNRHYMDLQEQLLNHQIDYDVINDHALLQAEVGEGKINLHDASYRVLILPSLGLLTEETATKIEAFYRRGGTVIASEKIPYASVHGKDPEVRSLMHAVFGIKPELAGKYYDVDYHTFEPYTTHPNPNGGAGHFTKTLLPLPAIIQRHVPAELEIREGTPTALRFHQRRLDDTVYYFLMNEEKQPNHFLIRVPDYGIPVRMDPATGESSPLQEYLTRDDGLVIPLNLEAWEALYLAFLPGQNRNRSVMLASTTLEGATLDTSEGKMHISGWAESGREHAVHMAYANGAEYTTTLSPVTSPGPIDLQGTWEFQPVKHWLDDRWIDRAGTDTLEIPVMKFFANQEGLNWKFPDPDLDDAHFPLIKISDLFSDVKGTDRYLDGWNASRIIYYDLDSHFPEIGGQDVTFRKLFHLKAKPGKALIHITADPAYVLLVNGREVGMDDELETVETYDLAPWLQSGENEILVGVDKHLGIIAEGIIDNGGEPVLLHTDASWEVRFQGIWEQAIIHSKPPLGSWPAGNIQYRRMEYPIECWYRQALPVGTRELILPETSGSLEYYIDGQIQVVRNNKIKLAGQAEHRIALLAAKAMLGKTDKGLLAPIRAVIGPAETEISPWEELGLGWYTGRGIYRKEFILPESYLDRDVKIVLDPGCVRWFAEIWINGELVRQGPWGDYRTDVTAYLRKGRNHVSIVVSNLKANEAFYAMPDATLDDPRNRWWQQGATLREKERLESGLLGPVRLIPCLHMEKDLSGEVIF
jgi:hypothetical protein